MSMTGPFEGRSGTGLRRGCTGRIWFRFGFVLFLPPLRGGRNQAEATKPRPKRNHNETKSGRDIPIRMPVPAHEGGRVLLAGELMNVRVNSPRQQRGAASAASFHFCFPLPPTPTFLHHGGGVMQVDRRSEEGKIILQSRRQHDQLASERN